VDKSDFVFISDSYLGHISIFKSGRFIGYLTDSDNQTIYFETPVQLRLEKNTLLVVDMLKNSVRQLNLSYKQQKETSVKHNKSSVRLSRQNKMSSRKDCVSCHLSWDNKTLAQSLTDSENKVLPVASEKMCYSCHHGAVIDSRRAMLEQHQHPSIYSKNRKDDKALTADDEKNRDAIPDIFPKTDNKELLCSSCHTPHNSDENQQVLYQGHKNSWMRVSNQDGNLCERCHESKAMAARIEDTVSSVTPRAINHSSNHPLEIKFLMPVAGETQHYVQEEHLQQGLPEELVKNGAALDNQQQLICQSCHQIHAGKGDDLLTLANADSELCISCHQTKYAEGKKALHQQGIHPVNIDLEEAVHYKGKEISTVTCNSCHQAHNGAADSALLLKQFEAQQDDLCTICHKDKYSNNPEQAHKKGIHPANFKLEQAIDQEGKKISEVNCSSCHNMHNGIADSALIMPLKNTNNIKDAQQALCVSCHQQQFAKDKQEAHQKGIHPVNIKLEQAIKYQGEVIEQLNCSTCHKVHQGKVNTALLWDGTEQKIETLCTICHQNHSAENSEEALEKGIHPVNIKLDKAIKINNKTIKTVSCLSCHSVHQGQKHTASLLQTDKNGQLCKNCHEQQQQVINTDHDLRLTASEQKNHHGQIPEQSGLCGSCHRMHKGHTDHKQNKWPFLYAAKTVSAKNISAINKQEKAMDAIILQRDQLCINCHQDNGIAKEKVVNHFSHPYKDLILRSNSEQMPLVNDKNEKMNEFGMIACISCHDPHSWSPAKTKKEPLKKENKEGYSHTSFLRQADVKGTFCVTCHGIEARIKYKYYHDPYNARKIGIDYLE